MLLFGGQSAMAQRSFHDQQRSADRAAYLNWLKYKKTKEEGGNLLKWWRDEGTIGSVFPDALTYASRSKYDSVEFVSRPSSDTMIRGTGKPLFQWHASSNVNYMLTRLGGNSMLSFSWGLDVAIMRWKIIAFDGNTLETSEHNLFAVNLGLPLTLDFKTGCDVDFDPSQKTCFAFGAGVMPMVTDSYDDLNYGQANFRVAPYMYASFGFYAWGCWKIRASFIPGKLPIFDQMPEDIGGVHKTLDASTGNLITLGISHMTYSGDWTSGRAWRRNGGSGGGGGRRRHFHGNMRMF